VEVAVGVAVAPLEPVVALVLSMAVAVAVAVAVNTRGLLLPARGLLQGRGCARKLIYTSHIISKQCSVPPLKKYL
jgi:hypothetical protein